MYTTKLRKDDPVVVVSGRERGKQGNILKINRTKGTVVVSGVNLVKKTMRKKRQEDKGGIVDVESPLNISNVMYAHKGHRSRIVYKLDKNGTKQRVTVKGGNKI